MKKNTKILVAITVIVILSGVVYYWKKSALIDKIKKLPEETPAPTVLETWTLFELQTMYNNWLKAHQNYTP